MKDLNKVEELINELRQVAFDNVPTRNDKVPESEDLSKSSFDNLFDIDIFFSRKPGMRRSVQLITSNSEDKEALRLSCMTAIASLCDTMLSNKLLAIEDLLLAMEMWKQGHGVKDFTVEEKN